MKIGHDGHPPIFAPIRDIDGAGKRTQEGQQNINADRVSLLHARGTISDRQFEAAVRLQRDWETGELLPRASSVLVGAGGGAPDLPNDRKVEAMRRHGGAVAAIPFAWPIVELVVHKQMTIEEAAQVLGWNRKFASGVLWQALHDVACYYGGLDRRSRRVA